MGKSNKFDFSNRPSSGAKLGKSIAQSLQREASKLQANGLPHTIDLQAPNKRLEDEGGLVLLESLDLALQNQDGSRLNLMNLDLSGNDLSSQVLFQLAKVLLRARSTIETINLANNHITVETYESLMHFESFIAAIQTCVRIDTLNLSGNQLGCRAFEALTRLHIHRPIRPQTFSPVVSISMTSPTKDSPCVAGSGVDFDHDDDGCLGPACIRGFDNVRQICLQHTGLVDSDALWLSYIIEHRQIRTRSINRRDSAIETILGDDTDLSESMTGIDWRLNDSSLGKDGLAVLQRAERACQRRLREQQSLSGGDESDDEAGRHWITSTGMNAHICASRKSGNPYVEEHGRDEHGLESVRRKIQRHMLEYPSHGGAELWTASLNAFWLARKLLCVIPHRHLVGLQQGVSHSADDFVRTGTLLQTLDIASASSTLPSRISNAIPGLVKAPTLLYSDALDGRSATRATSSPANGSNIPPLARKQQPPSKAAQVEPAVHEKQLESTERVRQIASNIVFHALSHRHQVLLSPSQIQAAVAWGLSRDTLTTEVQWSRHADSFRVWMLLNAIDGLVYENYAI